MKSKLPFADSWHKLAAPQRRRLLGLMAVAGLALLTEFGLRAWEHQQTLDRELSRVSARVRQLERSADQIDWAQRSAELRLRNEELKGQLWRTATEAQAQAMLRDWLQLQLKEAGIERGQLRLLATQRSAASSAPLAASAPIEISTVRVRANVSFELRPQLLETLLARIENGGQLAQVDSLNASRRSRRVELTISLPVELPHQPPADSATNLQGSAG